MVSSITKLIVSEVPESEIEEVIKTAEEWAVLARKKYAEDSTSEILKNSKELCENMSLRKLAIMQESVVICRDVKGVIQAIGIYNKYDAPNVEISELVTHPNNIPHPMNNAILDRVHGAGSAIVLHFARAASKGGWNLKVMALHGAQVFYEKLQFEHDKPGSMDMTLTVSRIRSLVASKIPPFQLIRP